MAALPPPAPLYLAKTIVHSFNSTVDAEPYVFELCASDDGKHLAGSASNNLVKLYDRNSFNIVTQFADCQARINHVEFSRLDPAILMACSSDGYIRTWDTRTPGAVQTLGNGKFPIWDFSVHREGTFVAGATDKFAAIWDTRKGKIFAQMKESHSEPITQVNFHPLSVHKLLTASMDGLMCQFDLESAQNEDDALEAVMNTEDAIVRCGFFGPRAEFMWCITGSENCCLWTLESHDMVARFENTRGLILGQYGIPVDYLIECHYSQDSNSLSLSCGNNDGSAFIMDINASTNQITPKAVMPNGHMAGSVVRALHWMEVEEVIVTGGEDARLCIWSPDATAAQSIGAADHAAHNKNLHHQNTHGAPKRRYNPY